MFYFSRTTDYSTLNKIIPQEQFLAYITEYIVCNKPNQQKASKKFYLYMQFLISALHISALQLFLDQQKIIFIMNFLINLFSCGSSQSKKPRKYVPALCIDRNQQNSLQTQKAKDRNDSQSIRTFTSSSKPISSMSQIVVKKAPQTKYLILKGYFNKNQRNINWGDLVGVVNYNSNLNQIIPNSTYKLKIGRNQEINCFATMRPYSLDWLIVCWGELQGDYGVKHFIRCRQPIIFIVQDWETLLKLIHIYEQELVKNLGEYCLLESKNKICFNIINYQNQYVIQFQQSQLIRQHTKQILQKSIALSNLAQQDFRLLLEKMTLNDYIDLQRDSVLMGRKIKQYLNEIERQKYQKQKQIPQAQLAIDTIYIDNLSQKEQPSRRKQSKSSDAQLQAQYFASIRKKEGNVQQELTGIKQQEQILKIFQLNNSSDIQESDQIQTQEVSRPFNFFRKIRSKSLDATYVPDQITDLDEEFYQKYS